VKAYGIVLVAMTIVMLLGSLIPTIPNSQAPVILQGGAPMHGDISVLVESLRDLTPADVVVLQSYGLVSTVAGPVAVIHTTISRLPEIARLNYVVRVERTYPLSVQLDRSVPDIGAPQVWDELKDPSGRNVTGAGVIIGFVDTGIDTTHPDFTYPNGTTKILYVWDQTIPGRPPDGFGYGYECTSLDIQNKTCPEVDTFGHGTHVAGIAAGSGVATGNYTGVAPGARIIFVKSGHEVCQGDSWTFDTNQILDGVNYMVKKAAELKMRLVVSLSLGGNIGAHDGTDPFELALDAFVKQGTPVVVAAGNDAQDQDHIDGQISQGQNTTFQLELKQTTTDVAIDIWYSPLDQLSGTLHAPDGTAYPIRSLPGGMITSFGELNTTAASFPNGNELYVEVNSNSSLPTDGWSISLIGNQIQSQGIWNSWTDTSTCSFPGSVFLPGDGYSVDSQDTIGIPATAQDVVSVGAYVTKTSWTGIDGKTYGPSDLEIGDISTFSSLGPTRDGRVKPDVVAPGEAIASARSAMVPKSPSDPDAFHRVLAGTSMATPHVAGTIALMLQYEPDLPAIDVVQILRRTARLDAFTGLLLNGSGTWGYGKVDARTATGFSRLTLLISGVPPTINVPLQVNGTRSISVPGGSWTDFYHLKGEVLNVSFAHVIPATNDTRYGFLDENLTGSEDPVLVLNYTPQYLLTVNSPVEPTNGTGWYNANSNATLTTPETAPAPGIPGYLGAEYVLAYWVTSDGIPVSTPVTVDGPMTVTAVYTLATPVQTLLEILIASSVVVVSAIIFARKKLS
jgi:subtilisin family serine protease